MRRHGAVFVATIVGLAALAGPARAQRHIVDLRSGARVAGHALSAGRCEPREAPTTQYRVDDWLRLPGLGRQPPRRVRIRERGGQGMMWTVTTDGTTLLGADVRASASAPPNAVRPTDLVLAVDDRTHRILWQRHDLRTLFAAQLGAGQVLLEAPDALVVIEARTGRELGRAAAGPALRAVCRNVDGRHYVKTSREVHAIDARTGRPLWSQASTSQDAPLVLQSVLVDPWIDSARRRYGIELHELSDGALRRRIDLGEVTAADLQTIRLAPVDADHVAVDAEFAVE